MKISILTLSSSEMVSSCNNSTLSLIRSTLYKNGQEIVSNSLVEPVSKILGSSLDFALQNSDCVLLLCESGLGKPYMAKKVICDKFGGKLINSIYAQKNIDDYIARTNVPLQKEDMSFCQMPDVARSVKNPLGVFQGCLCEKDNKILFLLPLAHEELIHMFFASVLPYILQSRGNNNKTFVLKTYGASYNELILILKDFIANKHNIEIVCNEYLRQGEIIVNVPKGVRSDVAENFVQEIYTKILPYVYSDKDESQPEFLYTLLCMYKQKVCFVEDFTSGNMCKMFMCSLPNAKDVISSSFVCPTDESKISLFDIDNSLLTTYRDEKELAYQLAISGLKKSGADLVVSTLGDIESGRLVYAIGSNEGVHIFTDNVSGSREQKIEMATNAVFFQLIKKIRKGDFGMGETI